MYDRPLSNFNRIFYDIQIFSHNRKVWLAKKPPSFQNTFIKRFKAVTQ